MNYALQKLCAITLFGLAATTAEAQTSLSSSGGTAKGSGGTATYSIGQVFTSFSTDAKTSLAEGIMQPFEIYLITTIDEGEDMSVNIYPNPTNDWLTLTVTESDVSKLTYQLYDMNGNAIQRKLIINVDTRIEMTPLSSATYFISIIKGDNEIKLFKIIKN